MDTMTTAKATNYTYDSKTLANMTVGYITSLKKWAEEKGYIFEGEIPSPEILTIAIEKASKRTKKHINRAISRKYSLRSGNLFLHSLHKKLGVSICKIELNEQEKAIIKARKKWKEQQKIADQLHAEYISAKGDFYKTYRR